MSKRRNALPGLLAENDRYEYAQCLVALEGLKEGGKDE